ncbi:MAG: hypothetical protein ACM34O_14875 [Ignavibacteria bacterium]
MFGKASLLLVLGFSTVFLIFGQHFGNLTTRAAKNSADYFREAKAYNIASTGANIAANKIFFDENWTAGMSDVPFSDGNLNIEVDPDYDIFNQIIKVTSVGTYEGYSHNITILLQPAKFSEFAYYSFYETPDPTKPIWWYGTDTVWGPFHTEDYLRCAEHPVFMGPSTSTAKTIKYKISKRNDKPYISGKFSDNTSIPLPSNGLAPLKSAAEDNGHLFSGNDTVFITFKVDSITYRFSYKGAETTVLGSDFAPNGVILAENAVLRLQGKVKGVYSVAASGSGGKGTVYLDDDIVYNSDPRTNPASTDLLGILAKNNVWITDNSANNNNKNINIHGSIYCETGGFGAENYNGRSVSGNIYLLGGIIQKIRKAVGTFNEWGITHGFSKRYKYDNRLLTVAPPAFPTTKGKFKVISWFE